MVRDTLVPLLLPLLASSTFLQRSFSTLWSENWLRIQSSFWMRKTKNGLQGCLPIQTIHCSQTNCTLTDNDNRFSKKKKKEKRTCSHHSVSRGQTTFFTLMLFLVRLVRSSYCVVFNILIRHERDLTEKQSLTCQF